MSDQPGQPQIDPVSRLSVLAAALPGAAVGQRRIAAPFDTVWRVIEDFERATPIYEPGVARVRVAERHGQHLHLLFGYANGREEAMDVRLRPGWCLMQSATAVVAFAARRLGNQTLLAHLEHRRTAAPVPAGSRSRQRRAAHLKIDQELRVIEALAARPGR